MSMAFLLLSILFVLAVATLVVAKSRSSQNSSQTNSQWSSSQEKTESGIQTPSHTSISPLTTPEVQVTGPIHIEPLPDFDWTIVEPEKHRPFKPTYHITMALRTCTPSDLILIDKNYLSRITSRRSIVANHASTVLGFIPEGIPAVYETYNYLLTTYLPIRYPTMFSLQTTGTTTTFHNHITNLTSPISPPPSTPLQCLHILSQTIEDDFFLMSLQPPTSPTFPNEHKTIAFICCHPAGFDPSSKLAQGLKAIHIPVPSYERIGPSMERFFARTEVGKPVKRMNWSVQTHTRLYSPKMNHVHVEDLAKVERDVDVDIAEARMRVELQTLTRLPETRALMFSFKTYMYRLEEIKGEGLGGEMADAIEGLGKGNAPGMWVYKGGVRWGKRVCEYLRG